MANFVNTDAAAAQKIWRRLANSSRARHSALALLSIAIFLSAWELSATSEALRNELLPPPSAVARAIMTDGADVFVADTIASLKRVAVGISAGIALGLITGLLLLQRNIRALLLPVLELLRPIPPLAWIPISILWFGFGDTPAYFLVALGAFFPMVSGTEAGFRAVEKSYVSAARSLGLSRGVTFWRVMLPQALPSLASAVHVGVGVAWMIVVTAELVGAQSGLGYRIQLSRAQLQTEYVIGGMAIIGAVGLAISALVSGLERTLMPWRRRGRQAFPT